MILGEKISGGSSWSRDDDIAFERGLAIFLRSTQFLLGLEKYGKGDWRSISRSFVVTRTPTQVASHAQKYFERLNSKNKNKKRPSIHDVSVAETTNVSTKQRPITWQNTRATSQPSLDHHTYGTPTIWNIPATSQPYHHLPIYGTPTMWNTQAASQPSINIPMYGTPTIGQSMVGLGPMVLPFGGDMNRLAAPHMAYGVQHHSVPYSTVPSAPMNIPYNMTYIPNSFS